MPIVCLLSATKKPMFVWVLNVGHLDSLEFFARAETKNEGRLSLLMGAEFRVGYVFVFELHCVT